MFLPSGHICHLRPSFYLINSCTFVVSVGICWDICTGSSGAVVVESIYFKELFGRVALTCSIGLQFDVPHKRHQIDEEQIVLSTYSSPEGNKK